MSFKEKTGKKVVLVGTCTRDELVRDWGYPAKGAAHGEKDLLYRIQSADATNDQPKSDKGGNFGRIARTGLMDDDLAKMQLQPVCGIRAAYWLEFFKIFHQDATDEQIERVLNRLRAKVDGIPESVQKPCPLLRICRQPTRFRL